MELLLCELFIEYYDNDSLVSVGLPIRVCLYLFTNKTWMLLMNRFFFGWGKLFLGMGKDFLL